MKRLLYYLLLTSYFALLLLACTKKEEDILAQVNDECITRDEFREMLRNVPTEYRDMVTDVDGKERLLSEWIMERLLVQEAYRLKLDKNPHIIKKIDDFKQELLAKELIKIAVLSKVSLNEKEIRDYYNLHNDMYQEEFEEIKQEVAKDALRKKQDVEFTRLIKKLEKKAKIRKNLKLLKGIK
ncbi:MAG: hypothetical protein QME40_02635 [bacterium]|nr:hypothetical protein [bacterium]